MFFSLMRSLTVNPIYINVDWESTAIGPIGAPIDPDNLAAIGAIGLRNPPSLARIEFFTDHFGLPRWQPSYSTSTV
jgi:hypothetical protein